VYGAGPSLPRGSSGAVLLLTSMATESCAEADELTAGPYAWREQRAPQL
jgi:hypothetical protein